MAHSDETPCLNELGVTFREDGAFKMGHDRTYTEKDGFGGVAPVGCFEPNAIGLYDMTGNVWEWTSDWYAPRHGTGSQNPNGVPAAQRFDPANSSQPSRSLKCGSYLYSENFCRRFRPAARQAQDVGLGTNHIGIRVDYDTRPDQSGQHFPEF